MKKIILIAILCFISTIYFGQFEIGKSYTYLNNTFGIKRNSDGYYYNYKGSKVSLEFDKNFKVIGCGYSNLNNEQHNKVINMLKRDYRRASHLDKEVNGKCYLNNHAKDFLGVKYDNGFVFMFIEYKK